ncbi:MAG: hypothetical protein JJE40_16395 [Vicinamibacteria bacterium]|nr:hypothetical protein [Vicinamibacteria bacterium]
MKHLLLAITLLLLVTGSSIAQDRNTAVATANTPVYIAPDTTRTPLRVAAQGTVFTVVAEEGEWTKVQFKDPQWGVRVGYVATSALRFSRPELTPMDLSATPDTARPVPPPVETPAAQPTQPRPWEKRTNTFERGWIDVNFGVAYAAEKAFTIEVTGPLFRETRTFRMGYQNPTGASFDFGGGVMITPEFGVGISFAGTAHQHTTDLFVSVPHPFAFNANATDTSETDREFQRIEGSVNIQAMGAADLTEHTRVRVFGGPTYFRVQQDLVSSVRYAQVFGVFTRLNDVAITDYEYVEKVEATGWGYHVGADVAFFFNRVVGIGAFGRYSRGRVDIEEPFADSTVELKAGGFQTGGGLRLKF